jgi:tRNA-dihydrouridine synthase A
MIASVPGAPMVGVPQERRGAVRPFSVAPMMDWTDRHYRRFSRELTQQALLYTEMITARALLHGDRNRLLAFDPIEHPVALQLGGDDPAELADAAVLAVAAGYDEINLNVGCPSDRVQSGGFGACLMAQPALVARAVAAMRAAVPVPVTVKHRLGIDALDSDDHLHHFAAALIDAGVDRLVVHARKAILEGLSPKANRSVPPLQPERVARLKERFPEVPIEINGGVRTLAQVSALLGTFDGVMIGRAAIEEPYLLAAVDARIYGAATPPKSRREAVLGYLPYVEAQRQLGVPWSALLKPIIPLVRDVRGARRWRRTLSEHQASEQRAGRCDTAWLREALGALDA